MNKLHPWPNFFFVAHWAISSLFSNFTSLARSQNSFNWLSDANLGVLLQLKNDKKRIKNIPIYVNFCNVQSNTATNAETPVMIWICLWRPIIKRNKHPPWGVLSQENESLFTKGISRFKVNYGKLRTLRPTWATVFEPSSIRIPAVKAEPLSRWWTVITMTNDDALIRKKGTIADFYSRIFFSTVLS